MIDLCSCCRRNNSLVQIYRFAASHNIVCMSSSTFLDPHYYAYSVVHISRTELNWPKLVDPVTPGSQSIDGPCPVLRHSDQLRILVGYKHCSKLGRIVRHVHFKYDCLPQRWTWDGSIHGLGWVGLGWMRVSASHELEGENASCARVRNTSLIQCECWCERDMKQVGLDCLRLHALRVVRPFIKVYLKWLRRAHVCCPIIDSLQHAVIASRSHRTSKK